MVRVGLGAADKGVQAFQPMDQAVLQQEVERAIDCRRRRLLTFGLQAVEDLVSPDRAMARPDEFEHPAPLGRQAHAAPKTQGLGPAHRVLDAGVVRMGVRG